MFLPAEYGSRKRPIVPGLCHFGSAFDSFFHQLHSNVHITSVAVSERSFVTFFQMLLESGHPFADFQMRYPYLPFPRPSAAFLLLQF
jgi:hypothetical protein